MPFLNFGNFENFDLKNWLCKAIFWFGSQFETMIDIVQISYFLKWIQNAIRYEVFGLSRTKVILDRSGDFCMLLLCWLDNLIKLVLYCLTERPAQPQQGGETQFLGFFRNSWPSTHFDRRLKCRNGFGPRPAHMGGADPAHFRFYQ